MPSIAGKYQTYKAEDMEPHLIALGLSFLIRKMMGTISPILEIIIDGDKVTMKTITPIKTKEITFTLGQEYDESMPDDSIMKSVAKIIGNELVIESVTPKGLKTTRRHVFTDDECIITAITEGVEKPGLRYCKRI